MKLHKENEFIVVQGGTWKLVFKVYFYNNNLTQCYSVVFTTFERASAFIALLNQEPSYRLVYLETIESRKSHRRRKVR